MDDSCLRTKHCVNMKVKIYLTSYSVVSVWEKRWDGFSRRSVSESQQDAAVSDGKVSEGVKLQSHPLTSSESREAFPEASAASHRHSIHFKTYTPIPRLFMGVIGERQQQKNETHK